MSGRYESFTVRVWVRSGELQRGEIVDVSTGEAVRFTDLEGATAFISEQIAARSASEESQPKHTVRDGHRGNGSRR